MASDEEWAERGVWFKVVTADMIPAVMDHLNTTFFPDEPVNRSLGTDGNSFPTKMIYIDGLKDGSSIAAVDKEGRIMAVRVGHVTRRANWGPWFEDWFMAVLKTFPFLVPANVRPFIKLFAELDFHPYAMLSKLPCEVMYDDLAVSSARWHGVKGLGTELVRRTEQLAKERGCTHTYAIVTGNYSARLFDKLGHTLLKAINYDDFRDPITGELYLKDTREHIQCRVYLKAL